MKISILLILVGISFGKAADIQSDVGEILKSEFTSNCEISLHKQELPDELKSQTEKQVQQKFLKSYVYIWKICRQDSLKGFAVLDNTYGKSLPITFLVVFSPDAEILRVDIIRYREPYGGAIGSRRWLDQFIGKSSVEEFKVDRDIDSISGATISVNSVARGVQKLTLVMEHIISEKLLNCPTSHLPIKSAAK
jgi:Na+-translocating ferredoxin:NAD+ oxidoreductase RnfG subunit